MCNRRFASNVGSGLRIMNSVVWEYASRTSYLMCRPSAKWKGQASDSAHVRDFKTVTVQH